MNPIDLVTRPFGYGFMQHALIAGVLVGIVCAVMGTFVVLKGLAFIGDAVSHAAFPGLVIAFMLGVPLVLGGTVFAIGTALLIGFVARRSGLRLDTSVGVLFAGAFAFGVMIDSTIQGFRPDLMSFLLGSVLGITRDDVLTIAVLGAGVLGLVLLLRKELLYATFDPLGAAASGLPVGPLEYLLLALLGVTIVVGIQAVGIILVVAMLVTPAATAQLLVTRFDRLMLCSVLVAIGSVIAGLYVSFYWDLAAGATIVLLQTLLFAAALALGPRTGLFKVRAARTGTALRPLDEHPA